ncbi:MAG: hypothetical protein II341_02115, partial [Oscillospiraceae bacterium]|nr:hypothetical protein [Oscillospiraceae bacterium]
MVGFLTPGNLRFSLAFRFVFVKQWAKMAAFRRQAKTRGGLSTKCIYAFETAPCFFAIGDEKV